MGWGNKAIEIRNVENGQLDGVFMHKRAQKLKFLCERNDKVDLKNRLTYLQFNHLFINTLYYVSGIFLIQRRLFMSNLLYDT